MVPNWLKFVQHWSKLVKICPKLLNLEPDGTIFRPRSPFSVQFRHFRAEISALAPIFVINLSFGGAWTAKVKVMEGLSKIEVLEFTRGNPR